MTFHQSIEDRRQTLIDKIKSDLNPRLDAPCELFVYSDWTTLLERNYCYYVGKARAQRYAAPHRNSYHNRVMDKHGYERRLEFTAHSNREALLAEIDLIKQRQTYQKENVHGTNLTLGGEGCSGWIATDEQKKKRSEARKRFYEDPKNRELAKLIANDPAVKEKRRKGKIRYWSVPSNREKASQRLLQTYADPTARLRSSESKRKRYQDPNEREKTSDAGKRSYERDPERRERMREKQIIYMQDASNRMKISKSVEQIDLVSDVVIATFSSIKEASRITHVNAGNLCQCCRGKITHTGGFKWRYAEKSVALSL